MMKTTIEIQVEPFKTPNFVRVKESNGLKKEGIKEKQTIPLDMLDSETLLKLCNNFTDEVFKKAGKPQPPRA